MVGWTLRIQSKASHACLLYTFTFTYYSLAFPEVTLKVEAFVLNVYIYTPWPARYTHSYILTATMAEVPPLTHAENREFLRILREATQRYIYIRSLALLRFYNAD